MQRNKVFAGFEVCDYIGANCIGGDVVKTIASSSASEHVVAVFAGDEVISGAATNHIIAGSAYKHVVAVVSAQVIIAIATIEVGVLRLGLNHITVIGAIGDKAKLTEQGWRKSGGRTVGRDG